MKTHTLIEISPNDVELIKSICNNVETENSVKNPYKLSYSAVKAKNIFTLMDYKENKELTEIVQKYIKLNNETEYIVDMHHINYTIGEGAKKHTDIGSSTRTYVILLNNSFTGGDFFLKNINIPLTMGQMIEFEANMLHEVKPIISGNREVFVIWIKNKQKENKSMV
jgi:hypothetical protein